MSLSNKPLESIDESDFQALLDNQVAEGKTIEYKQALPGNSDSDKREFLYDISSFANAAGGHLIFGIKEDAGVPTDICGLDLADVDAAILSLENSIRDGLAPRIPGLAVQAISLQNKRVAIVFRIPRSWALPHMVTFKGASKFYSRNSAGKYQLDVGELRAAFALSQSITDRIRAFRQERLSMIVAQETPVPIDEGAKLVLHIIPIGAFDPAARFDVAFLAGSSPQPLNASGWDQRHNFDGHLTFKNFPTVPFTHTYLQTFRNGIIEAVDTEMLAPFQGKRIIFSKSYEKEILEGISRFLSIKKKLGIEPPLFIMLSLLEVKGYIIRGESKFSRSLGNPIDRDTLLISEVMVEDFDVNPAKVMRPIFDAVWNAAGWPQCLNYDNTGNWVGR